MIINGQTLSDVTLLPLTYMGKRCAGIFVGGKRQFVIPEESAACCWEGGGPTATLTQGSCVRLTCSCVMYLYMYKPQSHQPAMYGRFVMTSKGDVQWTLFTLVCKGEAVIQEASSNVNGRTQVSCRHNPTLKRNGNSLGADRSCLWNICKSKSNWLLETSRQYLFNDMLSISCSPSHLNVFPCNVVL